VQFAGQRSVDPVAARRAWPQLAMKQRSEHHPYMVTMHRQAGGGTLLAVKGRPQEVLARCTHWFDGRRVVPLTAATRGRLQRLNDELASRGHRVLALACRRQRTRVLGETGGLTWLGMVGLADRVRPGVSKTIERFRAAGIEPKMLTGDQLGTAQAVARQIGLDDRRPVLDAGMLPERAAELGERAERAVGFARSTPAMKLELVRALQERGHVVAMTGDGINDGPAMKKADVGVAMGVTGTDFAHAMSDLVLQGDHPDDLLEAIAEGRTAYLNVRKAVKYLVATNLSELALTTTCAVLGLPDPLDPLALLWTNLITDVSPAIALGLEPAEPDILQRPPFRRVGGLLDRGDWRRVATDGGLMTAASLAAFLYGLSRYGASPQARTIAFMTLTSSQLAYALTARSESRLADPQLRSNRLLTGVTLGSLALQAGTVLLPPLRGILRTAPLAPSDWLVVAGAAALPALVREVTKRPTRTVPATLAAGARR
jgi:Ca2+-transporting ATPase